MGRLSKREKVLIILLIATIVIYAYYSVFLSPVLGKINTYRDNVYKYTLEVEKVRKANTIIANEKQEIGKLSTKLSEALKILPDMESDPEIAYNLNEIADTNNVKIISLEFGQPTQFKMSTSDQSMTNQQNSNNYQSALKLYTVSVTITIAGDYNSLMDYVKSLENITRISVINSLTLVNSNGGKLNLNITMNYFYSSTLSKDALNYDFNNGAYGKNDLFK